MTKYWCPNCEEWEERGPSFFGPWCKECGSQLEKEEEPESYEVVYKEVDISHKFSDEEDDDSDEENEAEDDTEEQSDEYEETEADDDSEADSDGEGDNE